MMTSAWLSIVGLFFSLIVAAPAAIAHGDHDSHWALAHESVHALEHFLEREQEKNLNAEGGVLSAEDDRAAAQAGELLLSAVEKNVLARIRELGPESPWHASTRMFLSLVKAFNPIALGRLVMRTAQRHGPGLGIAYGVTEGSEQVAVLMTTKYPEMAFLLPVMIFHVSDMVVFGTYFTYPKIKRALTIWRSHGGWIRGPHRFLQHLIEQKMAAPIDWSVVIDAPVFENIRFAVVGEGAIERRLPRRLLVLFSPRKLAQRESGPTLGVWELERIAEENMLPLWSLKPFKKHLRVYTRLLLAEIGQTPSAREQLGKILRGRLALASDAHRPTTVDVVAEIWVWRGRVRLARVAEAAENQSMGVLPGQRKLLRRLERMLGQDSRLLRLAGGAVSSGALASPDERERELQAALDEVNAVFAKLEETLPPAPVEDCEALLSGAERF